MNMQYGYEIVVDGNLSEDWSEWFAGVTIVNDGDGRTVLRGTFPDQAALFGLLARLHGLNLQLISVCRLFDIRAIRGANEVGLTRA